MKGTVAFRIVSERRLRDDGYVWEWHVYTAEKPRSTSPEFIFDAPELGGPNPMPPESEGVVA